MRNPIPVSVPLCLMVLAMALAPAAAQVQVDYTCRRPVTGSPCVLYKWYVCWPDSNTLTLAATTADTVATITHVNAGEMVRVQGIDAQSRAGVRSVASEAWNPVAPPPPTSPTTTKPGHGHGKGGKHLVYPNPFNPATTIHYELDEPAHVIVEVYDLAGRRVRALVDADLSSGPASVVWDGRDDRGQGVASGTYFCRLSIGLEHQTLRMLLVK
jgi:hypothetical protein